MSEPEAHGGVAFAARADQPLIGLIDQRCGTEVVHYFADEADADEALGQSGAREALRLLGAWSHLDSDDALDELDRIRHESRPTRRSISPNWRTDACDASYPIMERCAAIRLQLRSGPRLIGDIDTLIAATVLERDLTDPAGACRRDGSRQR